MKLEMSTIPTHLVSDLKGPWMTEAAVQNVITLVRNMNGVK
jgi:hypothetical protein